MSKNNLALCIGFILLILGVLSLVLGIIGARFSFLSFLDAFGTGTGLFLKVLISVFGVLIIVLASTPNKKRSSK